MFRIINISKKTLKMEYIINNKPMLQISSELDCSYKTIRDRLIIYNIPIRNHRNAWTKVNKILTKKFLIKEYIQIKKSAYTIAKETGYTNGTIYYYLKKYDIKSRSHSEALMQDKNPNFCIDCGKEISLDAERCYKCANTRENNPSWLNGKSFEEYGAEFDSSLKEQVRFRDGYKCQICGCSQLENGRQLDCHHIDYDKRNLKLKNLISLCRSCHMKTNFNREYWTDYFSSITTALISV